MFPYLKRVDIVEQRGKVETSHLLSDEVQVGDAIPDISLLAQLRMHAADMEYCRWMMKCKLFPKRVFRRFKRLETIHFITFMTITCPTKETCARVVSHAAPWNRHCKLTDL